MYLKSAFYDWSINIKHSLISCPLNTIRLKFHVIRYVKFKEGVKSMLKFNGIWGMETRPVAKFFTKNIGKFNAYDF